ncbi:MAG: metallophosphoesterase [Chloroflexota bacterium]
MEELRPDIILVTGDYANLSFNQDPETHALIRQFLS